MRGLILLSIILLSYSNISLAEKMSSGELYRSAVEAFNKFQSDKNFPNTDETKKYCNNSIELFELSIEFGLEGEKKMMHILNY